MADIYCCGYALNRKDDAIYEDASHQSATAMMMMMWLAGREDD
jgi:hypothetical protein